MLEETLCGTINKVVNSEINNQLLQIPNQIPISHLYQIIFEVILRKKRENSYILC